MNDFFKTLLIHIFFTIIVCGTFKFYIERHSVHPVYGNEQTILTCMPWDSCRK